MYRINDNAEAMSLAAIEKFTNPVYNLNSNWLRALEIWAREPDMVVILEGQPLDHALANLGNATPRMAAAQTVLRYLRELSNFQDGLRTPANLKMKCEVVGSKLWVWHKV